MLSDLLRAHIRSCGPLPFPSYMGLALYHPEHGYYAQGPGRTGRAGDFYTSVSVGAVFGELMAGQFCEVWEQLGKPAPFAVLERGASDGAFARDVLTWTARERPDFHAALVYKIDEPLPALARAQRERLAEFGDKVQWGFGEPAVGVFFANELLDAVPFRRVRWHGREWRELCVGLDEADSFTWVEQELRDYASRRYLAELGDAFPDGYTTEIAPAVATEVWLAGAALREGAVLLCDYGYERAAYYEASRRTGTLRCYRAHRAHEDPFEAPGATDITAHVDWTHAVQRIGAAGCEVLALLDQGHFLTGAAERTLRGMEGRAPDAAAAKWLRQFQTLTHPGHLGARFQVLVLGKGLPPGFVLSGLRHARGGHPPLR